MFSFLSAWQLLLLLTPLGIEVNANPVIDLPSRRPTFQFSPQKPWKPFPVSPPRYKYCYVQSHNDGKDDSHYILSALHECNKGGHVVFSKKTTYTIGTPLDLTFLEHVDLDIQGKITFTNDTDYWQANSFKYAYQNSSSYFQIGGEDVNVFGGGIIDGNGQVWWDLFASDSEIYRPILFVLNGLKGGSVSDITLYNSPMWNNFVTNSENIIYDNVVFNAVSDDKNFISNTDGWDIFISDNVVLQNSKINNGDDCVSFKPNATNVLVQNLWCNGSHGISVGSLGQYVGEMDIVENVSVYNISMNNASDGARIKVWPGNSTSSTDSGGGTGYVKNIIYDGMHNNNNQWAIEVTQCYGVSDTSICTEYPAKLTISDVIFRNFDGTTSTKNEPYVATVVCSSPNVCSNITAVNFHVLSPEDTNEAVCTNVDAATLGLNCTSGNAA